MSKRALVLSVFLFAFWIVLTASFSLVNLLVGLLLSLLVAFITNKLIGEPLEPFTVTLPQAWRLLRYFPHLVKEIVVANLDVAERVLNPHMPISPTIIKFKFPLKEPLFQIILANSITLTPGTLTVTIEDDVFYIHCLAEEHIDAIFGEDLQDHDIWIYKGEKK